MESNGFVKWWAENKPTSQKHPDVIAEEAWNAALAEKQRLMDLVRHQRGELLEEGLITADEFAALVADSEGGARVARLEGYDALRAENQRLAEALRTLGHDYDTRGGAINALSTWRDEWKERAEKAEAELSRLKSTQPSPEEYECRVCRIPVVINRIRRDNIECPNCHQNTVGPKPLQAGLVNSVGPQYLQPSQGEVK